MDKPKHQPGELSPSARLAQAIRVNQAGEYGAKRIYEGQLAVLRRRPEARKTTKLVEHMAEQEAEHLENFNRLMVEHRVRPTLLHPLWHVGAFALGAATALMGEKAAMACTVAVESVIDAHYAEQLDVLEDEEIKTLIAKFRADEQEHHATGLAEGAEAAPLYPLLSAGIRGVTRAAIALSKTL